MQFCMIEWSDLRIVLAVERSGTLTAAATELGVNQSTVTRRLAALRDALGARIVERSGGRYVLSALGEKLRPMLQAMEEQALAVERVTYGLDTRAVGTVRLTTLESLASRLLAPAMAHFRERVPDVNLEIDVNMRTLDLSRREADLALRTSRPRQETLVARRVGDLGFAAYASESYLARRGPVRLARGLSGHDVIADEEDARSWAPEVRWLKSLCEGARVVLRSQSWNARVAAVQAGAGISVVPCFMAEAAPGVVRLGKDLVQRELWLLVHEELRQAARVRLVLDYVGELIAANAARLAGDRG